MGERAAAKREGDALAAERLPNVRLFVDDMAQGALGELMPDDDVVEIRKPIVADSVAYRLTKRVFDVCACSVALVILALPMFVVAVKIKTESPGSVIYRQPRVGKDGVIFTLYKFRSMHADAEEDGACWVQEDDPRITPFGRWLRSTHFDEIPQFVNVIKGEMSLVGPRPERPVFCDTFERRIRGWHYRTAVVPGISGLAQVVGGHDLSPKEKVLLDIEYIEKRSLLADVKIMIKTLRMVLFRGTQ